MLITLNNNRTVDIPFEQYFDMSDEQYKNFLNSDSGESIIDPFYNSQLHFKDARPYGTDDDEMWSDD